VRDDLVLISALAARDIDTALTACPEAIPSADARAAALGDEAAFERVLADPAALAAAFRSIAGPLLAADVAERLAPGSAAESPRGDELLSGIAALVSPPDDPGDVLWRIASLTRRFPQEAFNAAGHLEWLYGDLPEDLPPDLSAAHHLPSSLGTCVDLLTLTYEDGARMEFAHPSVATPLLIALDQAGVRSAWDVLDDPSLAERITVPSTLLGEISVRLVPLGAVATAARLSALVMLLEPGSLSAREALLGVLGDERARVPAGTSSRLGVLALS
jgi:hypothetical protein